MYSFSSNLHPRSTTRLLLFSISALIVASFIFGLFVPLMDSDAAHHANIALRMLVTGDYISLIDKGQPYLDKPHLLFWTSALSFKIFGVNAFAYKLPSFLFTLLGLFSTFKLATRLYNKRIGWLSVLILSTAFAFVLANSDVRMDAILTACMIFTAWRFWEFYHYRTWLNMLAVALGLSLGFMTKGMIGPAVPTFAFLFYLLERKDWKIFLDPKLYLILPAFFLFSSPVLYAYYIQYDLHPELIIRGRTNISGVSFILWDQNFERFDGEIWGEERRKDYFFFLHTILWAFLPWPILFYLAVFKGFQSKFRSRHLIEWMTLGTILFLLSIYSFAGFKLPHYLNTLFPFMAILTAASLAKFKIGKAVSFVHLALMILVLGVVMLLNTYHFPISILGLILILATIAGIAYLLLLLKDNWLKTVMSTAAIGAIINLVMQANFYPQILAYQGGSALAEKVEELGIPNERIFYYGMISFSFDFKTTHLHPYIDHEELFNQLHSYENIYLYVNQHGLAQLEEITDLSTEVVFHKDAFHISRLNIKFINPSTREAELEPHYIVKANLNR